MFGLYCFISEDIKSIYAGAVITEYISVKSRNLIIEIVIYCSIGIDLLYML